MSARTLRLAVASVLQGVARRLIDGRQAKRVRPWFDVDGDETLRLTYPLVPSSTVLDVGGYKGQWASDIFSRYLCEVHIFEAVPALADTIAARFRQNPKIVVHSFGLGDREGEGSISVLGDRSSIYLGGDDCVPVRIRPAATALDELGISDVDLMKVNVEGAEYDLLGNLLEHGWVTRVRDLQIQFHDFVPDAEERMTELQARLQETHELTYQYPYVWENWRRRP